ncbi:MAG: PD-(D/E)XK nuclease family protein [Lachnospiraceae bacterium]
MQELLNRIRPVTEKDRELPVFSYSKLEVFKNCPLQYRYKYIEKKYSQDTSIALELGSLCHYVLEQKGRMVAVKQKVDYGKLDNILLDGVSEVDEKTKEKLLGVSQLKRKYFEVWHEADNASGASYDDKIKLFDQVLHKEMEDTEWEPTYFERPFEFVWDNKVILKGFIDRIDVKDGEYRTVDYKTSKKVYEQSKLATSLQFGIYALAILNEFGVLPTESIYRFILIDDEQYALTKGWEKRLIKALDKVFGDIEASEKKEIFVPKPSPLCHWCNFCQTNPEATIYRNECEYFSKWTPTQKTFEVNKKWNALENMNNTTKRKLVF